MRRSNIVWPCELSVPIKRQLLEAAQTYNLKPDDHLLSGKDANNGLFYAVSGLVILSIIDMDKSAPWVIFKPGDWWGGSLFDTPGFRFQVKVSCIDHAELLCISESVLKDMAEKHLEIYKLLYMVTRDRANEMTEMLFASTGLSIAQKVAFFLLSISKKFPHVSGAKPMISISQTTLAHLLGLSRPKLNRELQLLEQKKIIALERMNIYILENAPLEEILIRH